MNGNRFLLFLLSTILFFSCKKETVTSPAERPNQRSENADPTKDFLKEIRSDAKSEFYISGEFDGYEIYCSSTHGSMYQYQDTGFNAIYLDPSIGLDNIHLIRENDERTVMLAIYFDKANIADRTFPYLVPRANLDPCESVEMELINMKKLGTAGQHSPNDDFSFWSTTNNTFKIKVDRFADNVIEGTFEGVLRTETGASLDVKNGKFRIKTILIKPGK